MREERHASEGSQSVNTRRIDVSLIAPAFTFLPLFAAVRRGFFERRGIVCVAVTTSERIVTNRHEASGDPASVELPAASDGTHRHGTTRTGTNSRRHGVEQGPALRAGLRT
jgi:hypothetical protein